MKVTIFTYIPSPYQVELFNAIARSKNSFSLSVFYIYSKLHAHLAKHSSVANLWGKPPIEHNHLMIDDAGRRKAKARAAAASSDLVIFNYYRHPFTADLVKERVCSKKMWCFWGERPGYGRFGRLGALYRRWRLYTLYRWNVPIWGIGKWAVEGYRREFGENHRYFNLPYFSDLSGFSRVGHKEPYDKERIFLFSGSLIYRKGADLLASAFSKLAEDFPHVKLYFMGEGRLRPWLEKKLAKQKDRVRFLGFRPWKDLPQYYKKAHFLCVPSRYDGWAVTVPEGLAAGLPVISTDRTGAALEFIKEGQNGWIIPTGKKEALYKAMKEAVLLSSDELSKRSRNARMSIADHSLEGGVHRFCDAVSEILGSRA
ncbi:MAG: glycosyltransferase family 4 protein [Candidatus Omnitrophota bacterium]